MCGTLFWPKLTVTLRGPQCPAGIWVPTRGTHVVPRRGTTFKNLSPIYWPRLAPTFSWSHHVLPSATLRGPQWAPYRAPIWVPYRPPIRSVPLIFLLFEGSFGPSNGHPIGHPYGYPIGHPFARFHLFFFYLRAPSGPLMGTPTGHPYGYPMGHPFARFHYVKLLPLRGRHIHMGCPFGAGMQACSAHISLGSTSLSYCPFGAGMYVWGTPPG